MFLSTTYMIMFVGKFKKEMLRECFSEIVCSYIPYHDEASVNEDGIKDRSAEGAKIFSILTKISEIRFI